MPGYEEELLKAARLLLERRPGQRGRLSSALIRRSISTSYYALFHFLLDEVGKRIVGTGNDLRIRRRLLARTITHSGTKVALEKMRGATIDSSVADFLRAGGGTGPVSAPRFVRNFALAFSDAYTKRQDADYNLNVTLSEADARLLRSRVRRVIRAWKSATATGDRDTKHAVCALVLLKGQLRVERQ